MEAQSPNTDLIWRYLPNFWDRLPQEQREFIEGLWTAYMRVLDADYALLYQRDQSKALATCPVFIKYRWLLLDLSASNLANIASAGANIRNTNNLTTTTFTSSINQAFATENNIIHKHFKIIPRTFRSTITLPFALEANLVELYRLFDGILQNGTELMYGSQYTIHGNQLILDPSIPNTTVVQGYIGVDLTGLSPQANFFRTSFQATNQRTFILPAVYETGNIMMFVNGLYLDQSEYSQSSGNTIIANLPETGLVEFVWFTHADSFTFTERHVHQRQQYLFNNAAFSGTGTAGQFSTLPITDGITCPPTVRINGPESELRIWVGGKLIPDNMYTYNVVTSSIQFVNPYSWTSDTFVPVIVEWTNIQFISNYPQHFHLTNQQSNVTVPANISFFDDGGRFDDGGTFDTTDQQNVVTTGFLIAEADDLRVFFNGVLQLINYNFALSSDGTQLLFNFNIAGGTIRIEYERISRQYVYGLTDLSGLTTQQLQQTNMLLFYNEDIKLINQYSVNALGQTLTALEAYTLASQDVALASIPQLQDRIDGSTFTYFNETDYDIVDGAILSDHPLPDKVWCPVVEIDENTLAKNFGVVVNFPQVGSTPQYKAALQALWRGYWSGPNILDIEETVSMFLGIPFFNTNSTVSAVTQVLSQTNLITSSETITLDDGLSTQLQVGDIVFPGQSALFKSRFSTIAGQNTVGVFGQTSISDAILPTQAQIGDLLSIVGFNAEGGYSISNISDGLLTISTPLTGSIGLIQSAVFDATVLSNIITRTISWPKFASNIEVGSQIFISTKGLFTVASISGATLTLNIAVSGLNGLSFVIWNPAQISILRTDALPLVTKFGTVTAINQIFNTEILTQDGNTYSLPPALPPAVKQGDVVTQYQPLSAQVAVYDDHDRPNWLFSNNAAFAVANTEVQDQQIIVVNSNTGAVSANGFSFTDSATNFIGTVSVGDQLFIMSGLNAATLPYTVRIVSTHTLILKQNVVVDPNPIRYSVSHTVKSIEIPNTQRVSVAAPVTVTLTSDATASANILIVNDASQLPPQGVLRVIKGHFTELILYKEIVGNTIRQCIRSWNEENQFQLAQSLTTGQQISLVWAFSSNTLREVFYAAIENVSTLNNTLDITNNATSLYNQIKPHTTIIELDANSFIANPDLSNITTFLDNIIPSSSHWFIDINSALSDSDTIASTEKAFVSTHLNFLPYSLAVTGADGIHLTYSGADPGVQVNDVVFLAGQPTSTQYLTVTAISGNSLTMDMAFTVFSSPVTAQFQRYVSTGQINGVNWQSNDQLSASIQVGNQVVILDGENVGVYTVSNVVDNFTLNFVQPFTNPNITLTSEFYVIGLLNEII